MEIERKFLVKELPDLNIYPHKRIVQGYISTDPVIRVRQMGDTYCVCLKSQGHMIQEQCDALWPKVENSPVEKTRYFISLDHNLIAELDVYQGHLNGLLTVEVEFDSSVDAANFIPPSWFGEDITHDNRYKNNHLSVYGIPTT